MIHFSLTSQLAVATIKRSTLICMTITRMDGVLQSVLGSGANYDNTQHHRLLDDDDDDSNNSTCHRIAARCLKLRLNQRD